MGLFRYSRLRLGNFNTSPFLASLRYSAPPCRLETSFQDVQHPLYTIFSFLDIYFSLAFSSDFIWRKTWLRFACHPSLFEFRKVQHILYAILGISLLIFLLIIIFSNNVFLFLLIKSVHSQNCRSLCSLVRLQLTI